MPLILHDDLYAASPVPQNVPCSPFISRPCETTACVVPDIDFGNKQPLKGRLQVCTPSSQSNFEVPCTPNEMLTHKVLSKTPPSEQVVPSFSPFCEVPACNRPKVPCDEKPLQPQTKKRKNRTLGIMQSTQTKPLRLFNEGKIFD